MRRVMEFLARWRSGFPLRTSVPAKDRQRERGWRRRRGRTDAAVDRLESVADVLDEVNRGKRLVRAVQLVPNVDHGEREDRRVAVELGVVHVLGDVEVTSFARRFEGILDRYIRRRSRKDVLRRERGVRTADEGCKRGEETNGSTHGLQGVRKIDEHRPGDPLAKGLAPLREMRESAQQFELETRLRAVVDGEDLLKDLAALQTKSISMLR